MNNCKICNGPTELILDFGNMPIANAFVTDPSASEFLYHMSVVFCPKCFMVQLANTVPPEMMFNDHYAFISSTSNAMAIHFENLAKHILDEISLMEDPFVVELGSNDGIMLKHIKQANVKHLGVEPSKNVADMGRKIGVNTTSKFFNVKTADEIIKEYGKADVISGSNVMCHIEDINSVFDGIKILLKDDGVLHFEDPYIYDIVKLSSFDQMYDEHVYYFSGLSVQELGKRHGLQLVDMKAQNVHGGSMRYYLKKEKSSNKLSKEASEFIKKEKGLKLDKMSGYTNFRNSVNQICSDLTKTLTEIKSKGYKIAGYGATSKSTTLFNYANINPDLIEYISDITPTKIGKYTPGVHIPVKSHDLFLSDNPSYTLLLAWNHKKEIIEKEANYIKNGGKFITYFPEVEIYPKDS